MRSMLSTALLVATTLAGVSAAQADVVTDWNEQVLDSIRAERTNPPRATRFLAMTHTAIFDAVNGIAQQYEPYLVPPAAPDGASMEAAAAAAAHRVLSAAYPARQEIFDAALADSLAAVADGPSKSDGMEWGIACADVILAARSEDGSDEIRTVAFPEGSNWWIRTPPGFAPALLPNWPYVQPWTMHSGDQFRAPAPPPSTSPEYTRAFREVRRLGRYDSTFRTEDQSEIAQFWDDGAGTDTPPGHWQEIAQTLSDAQGNGLVENARLFALLGLTVADAAIVAWDTKYYYGHWRPQTGIFHADTDGNPETQADTGWFNFITTPPFPTYTSGHSTFSGASSRLLALFYGRDDLAFTATSDGLPGVVRSYDSLSQAGEEAGQSRIYGGIHWQYDNTEGLKAGRALADYVFHGFLRPLDLAPDTCQGDADTLCLQGGRFSAEVRWKTAAGATGTGTAVTLGDDSGYFWFFNPDNPEMTVKLLDGCTAFDRYWVFASGLTNVEVTLTVADTATGKVRQYFNPLGKKLEPIQDTAAFATCP